MSSRSQGYAKRNSNGLAEPVDETLFALHAFSLKQKASDLAREIESLTDLVSWTTGLGFKGKVRQFEIRLIEAALMHTGGHQAKAARLLEINVTTLNEKIKRYGIQPRKNNRAQSAGLP